MDFGNFFREESGDFGEQLSLQFNNIRIERWRVDRILLVCSVMTFYKLEVEQNIVSAPWWRAVE